MRHVGPIAFAVTCAVLTPAALHELVAGKDQRAKLIAVDASSFTLPDGTAVEAAVDKGLLEPGDKIALRLTTHNAHARRVTVGVLVVGSTGDEGSRVPSPPIGVTHETVTLEADASGAASRTVTLALRGARSNEYRPLAHYTVMVMAPASAAKLERTRAGAGLIGSRGEIPEYNRDAQRFMAAMWAVGRDADEEDAPAADADRMTRDRYAYTQLVSAGKVARIEVHSRPNNPAIAIAAPDTTAPGAPFTVAVTVRNPTGRPIDNLAIQLDSLAGMIGEGFAETNYRGLAVDAIQVEGDGEAATLAAHATRRVEFRVTPRVAGVVGLYAHVTCDSPTCYARGPLGTGTVEAIEAVHAVEAATPTVARR